MKQDYAEAMAWRRRAAAKDLPVAEFDLGTMYEKGQGVPLDFVVAVQWFRRAAAQGYAPAQESLDRITAKQRSNPDN